MDSSLFIPDHDVWKICVLLKSLSKSGQVPVTKDSGTSGKKLMLHFIPLSILVLQKS